MIFDKSCQNNYCPNNTEDKCRLNACPYPSAYMPTGDKTYSQLIEENKVLRRAVRDLVVELQGTVGSKGTKKQVDTWVEIEIRKAKEQLKKETK